eukprot:4301234-Prymnesium_polylepis.2
MPFPFTEIRFSMAIVKKVSTVGVENECCRDSCSHFCRTRRFPSSAGRKGGIEAAVEPRLLPRRE